MLVKLKASWRDEGKQHAQPSIRLTSLVEAIIGFPIKVLALAVYLPHWMYQEHRAQIFKHEDFYDDKVNRGLSLALILAGVVLLPLSMIIVIFHIGSKNLRRSE